MNDKPNIEHVERDLEKLLSDMAESVATRSKEPTTSDVLKLRPGFYEIRNRTTDYTVAVLPPSAIVIASGQVESKNIAGAKRTVECFLTPMGPLPTDEYYAEPVQSLPERFGKALSP